MKVLVTGSEGFIGGHLTRLFTERDIPFEGFDLKSGQDIRLPLEDKGYSHIVHLAARKSVPDGERSPQDFIQTNCWGTVNLIRSFPKARFINISSSSVNEPRSIYGITKLFAEQAVNTHPNALSIRLYNVFGESQPYESGALIPRLFHHRKYGGTPTLYGNGSQSRDFTYVGDVVEHILEQLDSNETGVSHYGYGNPISVKAIASSILGESFAYRSEPLRSFEIADSVAPISNHTHTYGRTEGLKRTIAWYDSTGT